MHVYQFKTSVGTFEIRPDIRHSGRWQLRIILPEGDFEILGSYAKDFMAADDVAEQATGWHEWDMPQIPHDLRIKIEDINEWHKSPFRP
jgi:hypothetical protein